MRPDTHLGMKSANPLTEIQANCKDTMGARKTFIFPQSRCLW